MYPPHPATAKAGDGGDGEKIVRRARALEMRRWIGAPKAARSMDGWMVRFLSESAPEATGVRRGGDAEGRGETGSVYITSLRHIKFSQLII